jgi:hypothetical protein
VVRRARAHLAACLATAPFAIAATVAARAGGRICLAVALFVA